MAKIEILENAKIAKMAKNVIPRIKIGGQRSILGGGDRFGRRVRAFHFLSLPKGGFFNQAQERVSIF